MSVIVLSGITVDAQQDVLGLPFLEGKQYQRHVDILLGQAGDPWQYRILPQFMLEPVIRIVENHLTHPVADTFLAFRIFQNALIFIAVIALYRKLGLSTTAIFISLNILAWAMMQATYDSDLQFSTYFDILFYLLAALVLLSGKYYWIIPIILFAALNRETSGLIPLMVVGYFWFVRPANLTRGKAILISALSFAIFIIIFLGLRWYYGPRPYISAFGHYPGLDILSYNLKRIVTYVNLAGTLGIIPLVALLNWKTWSPALRSFFWIIVPLWFSIHALMSIMAETRLFLVPMALVFIPGALSAFRSEPAQDHFTEVDHV